jgi:NAD(P)-dependent dehydrogenase (short-subunit alcohol dehydrogenase family)
MPGVRDLLSLDGRVVVITGGGGLLGREHALAVAELGARVVLLDLDASRAAERAEEIDGDVLALGCDITDQASIADALAATLDRFGRIDGLVNNAANNPKVEGDGGGAAATRLESLSLDAWQGDLAVGLTGALLCAQAFGGEMARRGGGAIVNVASDLALIGPDQRIYREPGRGEDEQFVKPVSYSVVKSGLLGLTRWLATYWAEAGVRCNAISPGGVANDQPADFVARLAERIPLGRMAAPGEYRGAIVFLLSDASSYMTGANLVVDGGRTAW